MDCPMDKLRLEQLANNDQEIERELFRVFFKEVDLYIRIMIKAQVSKDDVNWKETVIRFKAAAVYLGAVHLADFLSAITEGANLSNEAKTAQIKVALREVGKVKEFYEQRLKSTGSENCD